MTQQTVFAWEIADRRVATCLLPTLARALDVPIESLLGLAPVPSISRAQIQHVEQLRKLGKDDRFAILRITEALMQLGR